MSLTTNEYLKKSESAWWIWRCQRLCEHRCLLMPHIATRVPVASHGLFVHPVDDESSAEPVPKPSSHIFEPVILIRYHSISLEFYDIQHPIQIGDYDIL